MKKSFYLAAAAVLLMATSNAQAGSGFNFEIGGQKIHIDAPRNCSSLNCLSVSNNGSPINLKNLNLKGKNSNDDDDVATNSPPPAPQPPAPAVQAPPPAPAPVENIAPPAPVANTAPPAPPAPTADASRERITGLPATTNVAPPVASDVPPAPPPVANAAPPAPPAPVANTAPPAPAPNTPVGLWQTQDNKGNVRIEQCGANLCGYAEKTNERILINMKPASENKWSGRIHDPDSGSNYDSTIALKGANLLKVQGCAFGGMFCGGQTWKRVS